MKTVCIVGAGPAGLVGAKTLLKTGAFRVTILEKAERVGGIWAHGRDSMSGFLSPQTPINLSKFSVSFSDFRWDSLNFGDTTNSGNEDESHQAPWVSMFPKAWQVNQYLEAYRSKFIPNDSIRVATEVIKAVRISSDDPMSKWRITSRQSSGKTIEEEFDFLLLGSGFFSKQRPLQRTVETDEGLQVKAIHSSQFKQLSDLFPDPEVAAGKDILVIGGGVSAGEAAASIAQQLSDARWSPATGRQSPYASCKIFHVLPRPILAVPPYVAADEHSRIFMPLDFKLFDLSKRLPGPIVSGGGQLAQQVKAAIYDRLVPMIGGDQSDLGSPALVVPTQEPRSAVQLSLTESYPEFVRSRLIQAKLGRVQALKNSGAKTVIANVISPSGAEDIANIGAVVFATGYTPVPALDFLSDEVKTALRYDSSSLRLPLVLQGWQTMADAVPSLAVLGFYEGPYWGVIEMQARFTAHRWLTGDVPSCQPYEEVDKLLSMRTAMEARGLDIPQYWFGDYLGYMEEIASFLKLRKNNGNFEEREGPTAPARYVAADDESPEAAQVVEDLHSAWKACLRGRNVARATFRALQGSWQIRRTIDSALPSFPSGMLEGSASFHPRSPTQDRSGKTFDFEYLYIETGTLTLSNGASMPAKRRYVYRYSEVRDEMSVWFVKPDNDLEVDYLFHNLQFVSPEEAIQAGACVAKADHLCVKDMYWTEYRMPMQGISLHQFSTTHKVKGPSKDYVAATTFSRP